MPDKNGFNHLLHFGTPYMRCMWCHERQPGWADERVLVRHARKHRKDAEAAAAASLEERQKAEAAVS